MSMKSVKKRTDDAVDIRFGIQTKAFWSKWERQWWTTCLQKLLAYEEETERCRRWAEFSKEDHWHQVVEKRRRIVNTKLANFLCTVSVAGRETWVIQPDFAQNRLRCVRKDH